MPLPRYNMFICFAEMMSTCQVRCECFFLDFFWTEWPHVCDHDYEVELMCFDFGKEKWHVCSNLYMRDVVGVILHVHT
jgi:hypothetical protein